MSSLATTFKLAYKGKFVAMDLASVFTTDSTFMFIIRAIIASLASIQEPYDLQFQWFNYYDDFWFF